MSSESDHDKRPDFSEKRLSGEVAFAGNIIKVHTDQVLLPNGKEASREVARHPGASVIVPMPDADTVLLEWQFRYAHNRHLLEFPAGKLDPGEDPETAAKRELLEETGYIAESWTPLLISETTPGFSDEKAHIYLAKDLQYEGHPGEPDEFLTTEKISLQRALQLVESGEITDAKTVLAILWLHQFPHLRK